MNANAVSKHHAVLTLHTPGRVASVLLTHSVDVLQQVFKLDVMADAEVFPAYSHALGALQEEVMLPMDPPLLPEW